MAKSARASSTKRNRANLRGAVFGPVVDARTQRLSEKLHELASHPNEQGKDEMKLDTAGSDHPKETSDARIRQPGEDMDIDERSTKATKKHTRRSEGVQKRDRRKSRSSIVFQHPKKTLKKR